MERGLWPKDKLIYPLHKVIGGQGPLQTIDVKGGLGAQPPGYTAKIDFWHRGPSRAPVSHKPKVCDEDANTIQGIRTHWAKGPMGPIRNMQLI